MRSLNERFSIRIDVKSRSAKGDALKRALAIVATAGSVALSVPAGAFTAADIGKLIEIPGAGSGGTVAHRSTIAAVPSSTSVTLGTAPQTSVSATVPILSGTDDTDKILEADGIARTLGFSLGFPPGGYLVTGNGLLNVTQPIIGDGIGITTIYGSALNTTHTVRPKAGTRQWWARGVTFDGGGAGCHNLSISGCDHIIVESCEFRNSNQTGLKIALCNYAAVTQNLFEDTGTGGCDASAGSLYIFRNKARNTGGANYSASTYASSTTPGEIVIAFNTGDGAGFGPISQQDNITAYDSTGAKIRVMFNTLRNSANHNAHVGGDDCEFVGNDCDTPTYTNVLFSTRIAGTSTFGAPVRGRCSHNVLRNSGAGYPSLQADGYTTLEIQNNFSVNSGAHAFAINNCADLEMSGNHAYLPAAHGIRLAGVVKWNCHDNTIELPQTNPVGHCISMLAGTTQVGAPISCSNGHNHHNLLIGGISAISNTDGGSTGIVHEANKYLGQTGTPISVVATDLVVGNLALSGGEVFAFGRNLSATGRYGSVMGLAASDRGRIGVNVYASANLSGVGGTQSGYACLSGRTNAGTSTNLTTDGAAAGLLNLINIPVKCSQKVTAGFQAIDGSQNTKTWDVTWTAKNVNGTITIVASSVTVSAADTATSGWTLSLSASQGNKAVLPSFTGGVAGSYVSAETRFTETVLP